MKKREIDFKRYSSIKIGPKVDVWIIEREDEIRDDFFIIGGANNLLVSDNPPPLAMLSKKFKYIEVKDDKLFVGAATPSGVLYSFCKKNNIGGFEFLAHLPGTIGGSIKMNAGVKKEEISNNLISINKKDKNNFKFSYRYSNINFPIFEAVFEIKREYDFLLDKNLKNLRANQPSLPSLGSVFKNPKEDFAGRLIEKVGMKGIKKGGIMVSEIHANFFVNIGGGSFEDMIYLINLAKKRVFEEFGINLEEEIKII